MRTEAGIDFDEGGAAVGIAADIHICRAAQAHHPRRRERQLGYIRGIHAPNPGRVSVLPGGQTGFF